TGCETADPAATAREDKCPRYSSASSIQPFLAPVLDQEGELIESALVQVSQREVGRGIAPRLRRQAMCNEGLQVGEEPLGQSLDRGPAVHACVVCPSYSELTGDHPALDLEQVRPLCRWCLERPHRLASHGPARRRRNRLVDLSSICEAGLRLRNG